MITRSSSDAGEHIPELVPPQEAVSRSCRQPSSKGSKPVLLMLSGTVAAGGGGGGSSGGGGGVAEIMTVMTTIIFWDSRPRLHSIRPKQTPGDQDLYSRPYEPLITY